MIQGVVVGDHVKEISNPEILLPERSAKGVLKHPPAK